MVSPHYRRYPKSISLRDVDGHFRPTHDRGDFDRPEVKELERYMEDPRAGDVTFWLCMGVTDGKACTRNIKRGTSCKEHRRTE